MLQESPCNKPALCMITSSKDSAESLQIEITVLSRLLEYQIDMSEIVCERSETSAGCEGSC